MIWQPKQKNVEINESLPIQAPMDKLNPTKYQVKPTAFTPPPAPFASITITMDRQLMEQLAKLCPNLNDRKRFIVAAIQKEMKNHG